MRPKVGKWLLLALFGPLLSLSVRAQLQGLPHVERYTHFNGLPNNSIRSLYQDSIGFLWIGTEDGLCRFDGSDFFSYNWEADDGSSISDNITTALSGQAGKQLLIGTQTKGLNIYHYRQAAFSYLNAPELRDPDDEFFINAIQPINGESREVWLGTAKEALRLIWRNDSLAVERYLADVMIHCLWLDGQDNLWAGTAEGLYVRFSGQSDFRLLQEVPVQQTGDIRSLVQSPKGDVLIGGIKGVFLLPSNPSSPTGFGKMQALSPPYEDAFKVVNALTYDREGRLWVAGQNGLSVLNANYEPDLAENRFLQERKLDKEHIRRMLLDREDNLWLGTANNGLLRLSLSNTRFPRFRLNPTKENEETMENIVRSIYAESDHTLWIGSYGGGLHHFDRKSLQFRNYRANPAIPQSLSGNQVSSIYRDRKGKLWVGTWGDGLNEVLTEGEKMTFQTHPLFQNATGDDVNQSSIHQLLEDEYDNLWVATNGGIARRAAGAETFEGMNQFLELSNYNINHVLEDQQGNWWLGTWHGLMVYDREQIQAFKKGQLPEKTRPRASYYYGSRDTASLFSNRITSLYQSQAGHIWIATYGGGLSRWMGSSLKDGYFKTYRQTEGLPNEVIYGILEDAQARLWLSTNNGLVLFDPKLETFQVFTDDDGLQSNQFYFGAYEKTKDQKMVFGGKNGFNVFDPESFSSRAETPPQVMIDHFYIKGEPVPVGERSDGSTALQQSILSTSYIELQPYDNSFRFEFNSFTFNHASRLKYAYQLVGFDEQERKGDFQNRFALYSNLYEGDYRFEVKASLDGQSWSPVRDIDIKILPPWYRSWWAYVLFILLLLGVIGAIIFATYVYSNLQNKLNLEKLSRQKEAEISEMRLWFFTYLSHEFRTPLTLIISPLTEMINDLQIGVRVRNKLRLVHRNSQRLSRLVNQILNFRLINTANLQLSVQQMDLVLFSREIFLSFAQHAQERKISYQFDCSEPQLLLWFDTEKMELVLYNLLSNAFKYSDDKAQIKLLIRSEEERVCIEVQDSGIGIKASQIEKIFEPFQRAAKGKYSGSGIGLALVKSLVEFHLGSIEVESQEGQGTTFRVYFPKDRDLYDDSQINLRPVVQSKNDSSWQEAFIENNKDLPQVVFAELSNKERLKLLFVEDNSEIRTYFANYFKKDFHVLQATNGLEGHQMARKHLPDLIISDVMMPKMDGVQMVKKIKEDNKTNHIPIILLTAKVAIEHQLESLQKGIFDYIPKPVNIQLLRAKVFACLNNIRQLKEYYKHEGILPQSDHHSSSEDRFLLKAAQTVEQNLNSADFNAQEFAQQMGISRSGLYKKLQQLTEKSTTQFIRFIRLKHAEKLLKEGNLNISQTAFQVGFNDLKYFRKCFKKEFGVTPTEYLRNRPQAVSD